jgi:hypothetical protein
MSIFGMVSPNAHGATGPKRDDRTPTGETVYEPVPLVAKT